MKYNSIYYYYLFIYLLLLLLLLANMYANSEEYIL